MNRQRPTCAALAVVMPILTVVMLCADVRLWGHDTAPADLGPLKFRHIVIDRHPYARPHCKTAGDLDGDGAPDVLAASHAGAGLFWYQWPDWTKRRIDSGAFTTDTQVADVDDDGDLDIIIPKIDVGLVWYENPRPKGNPTSDEWKLHAIDSKPAHDVEVGDVDGDGKVDIVVREETTRVYWQESPDKWHESEASRGGRGGTALGDIDGDGNLDIAQNGYWLEAPADRDGAWTRHEMAPGWPDDVGVLVTDINKDGRPDVLIAPAEEEGKLVWYESPDPKKGPWKEHVIDDTVSHVHTFKVADVNRDGNLDVIIAEMEQSRERRIMILLNQGDALRWDAQVVGRSGSHNVRVADIGNDGDVDIIGANHGNHGGPTPIEYWENLSSKPASTLSLDQWERHVIDSDRPERAVFIVPADVDGDGKPDLVTGAWWYRNPGEAEGDWTRQAVGEGFGDVAVAYDFDRDGAIDLLGTKGAPQSKEPTTLAWARNDGKGAFKILDNIPEPGGDFLQGVAIVRPYLGRSIQVALSWHAAGKGVQMLSVPKDPSSDQWGLDTASKESQDEALSVGLIDGEVLLDLLLGTKWLRNEETKWTLHTLHPTEGDPDRNKLVDMNGNGRLDAVVGFEAINEPGKLAWYEQPSESAETWTEHVISLDVVGPMSVDVADIDRDGDVDVIVGEHNYEQPETAKLHIFENIDGKSTEWKDHVISVGDEHHDGAVVVDIEGDGDLDIVSIGWSHRRVLLYENKAIRDTQQSK
ncbi:MAG: VCBS repeat-containing protein [Luteitalea sp.]|nr:VCBS repeat-containing protein [Luteitalea sp.]